MEINEFYPSSLSSQSLENINVNRADESQYKSYYPIDMIFETVHSDNPDQYFTVTMLTPSFHYSSSQSYSDPANPLYRKGLHQHVYFELIYVIDGRMYQNIENKRHLYSKGSLCLLNRNIHHAEEFTTDFRAAFLSLPVPLVDELLNHTDRFYFPEENTSSLQMLSDFFNHNINDSSISVREYIDFIPKEGQSDEQTDMYNRFSQLTHIFVNPAPGSSFLLKGLLLRILSALSDKNLYDNIPINIGTENEARLFDKISELIAAKNGRISRSELSARLQYDGSYLNSIVKKYSGLNLFNYGTVICMKEAKRLLRETDMSIAEVAEKLDFTNRTHFYKLFEKHCFMTPKEYRRSLGQKSNIRHQAQ